MTSFPVVGNIMLSPQNGWGNQIYSENLYFSGGIGYFIGNLPNYPTHVFFPSNVTPLQVPTVVVPQFNMFEQELPMEMVLGTQNNSRAREISFPSESTQRLSTSNPFEMENQDDSNVEQYGQLQLAGGNAEQLPLLMPLPHFNPMVRTLLIR